MQTEHALKRAANASRKKAQKRAKELATLMHRARDEDPRIVMPLVREALAELNQRVHEFNAYKNAAETNSEPPSEEDD